MVSTTRRLLKSLGRLVSPQRKLEARGRLSRYVALQSETLEDRRVMAGAVFSAELGAVWAGFLIIEGTRHKDVVEVQLDYVTGNVRVVGQTTSGTAVTTLDVQFTRSAVTHVRFLGYRGDDEFTCKIGVDVYADGGPGNDWLACGYGFSRTCELQGGDGDDRLFGDFGTNYMDGGAGRDYIAGTGLGKDEIHGGEGDDKIYGQGGEDRIFGESGNDEISGEYVIGFDGAKYIDGGDGDDTITGSSKNDVIIGGAGKDKIHGGQGDDRIEGGNHDDILYGDGGNDTLIGGRYIDQLYGGDDDDKLYGQEHDDVLYGDAGNDELYGGSANDKLFGGAGNDKLYGEIGDDFLSGEGGVDRLDGAAGFDRYRDEFGLANPYETGMNVRDVDQQDSGICQTLSAIAAALNAGFRFDNNIRYVGNGQYDVTLYRKGFLNFGVESYTQRVAFDGSWSDNDAGVLKNLAGETQNNFWVLLLTRARYAEHKIDWNSPTAEKKFGPLDNFTARNPGTAIFRLTGKDPGLPSSIVLERLPGANSDSLRKAIESGSIVVAGTSGNPSGGDPNYVKFHAYAVLKIYEGGLVWLYNPWGSDGPKGAIDNSDDGYFLISWEKFKYTFAGYWKT